MTDDTLAKAPLGQKTPYVAKYTPSLLFPIPRKNKREEIGVPDDLPFQGVDFWNAYEISWLNPKGKPEVAIGEFIIPCESPFLIESKSVKLYLNSFNQSHFPSKEEVQNTLVRDLSQAAGGSVQVSLRSLSEMAGTTLEEFSGVCIDNLDIETDIYLVNPNLIKISEELVEEELHSHLLKSNCLVTGQPDWGSLYVHYVGLRIDHASFLKYIISFRQHNEFHEQCIERIFMDISRRCQPEKLTVYGKYTRRGGLDINPFRSNFEPIPPYFRATRQ